MLTLHTNLRDYIESKLTALNCEPNTKAYITTIFLKYKIADLDFSNKSVTLMYYDAKEAQSFEKFQNVADWLFFAETTFPKCLNGASEDYYRTIARLSYYSCYKLIQKQWKLFEELSDNYDYIVNEARGIIKVEAHLGLTKVGFI